MSELWQQCGTTFASEMQTPERWSIMKRSTKDRAEGKIHELKGAIKEQTGKLTADPALEVEGNEEKNAGKMQQIIGNIVKAIEA